MNIEQLTFGIKDVLMIISAVISIISFIFAIRKTADNAKDKIDGVDKARQEDKLALTKLITEETAEREKANDLIVQLIQEHKKEAEKRENFIYERINDVREEHRDAYREIARKMDSMAVAMTTLSSKVSELTGYIKGKSDQG